MGVGVFLPDGGGVPAEGVADQLPEGLVSIDLAVVGPVRIAVLAAAKTSGCRFPFFSGPDDADDQFVVGTDIGVLVISVQEICVSCHIAPIGLQGHIRLAVVVGQGTGGESDADDGTAAPFILGDIRWRDTVVPGCAMTDGHIAPFDAADESGQAEGTCYRSGGVTITYRCGGIANLSNESCYALACGDVPGRIAILHCRCPPHKQNPNKAPALISAGNGAAGKALGKVPCGNTSRKTS